MPTCPVTFAPAIVPPTDPADVAYVALATVPVTFEPLIAVNELPLPENSVALNVPVATVNDKLALLPS